MSNKPEMQTENEVINASHQSINVNKSDIIIRN